MKSSVRIQARFNILIYLLQNPSTLFTMHSDLQDVRVLLRPYNENKPHIIVERQNYGLNLLNLQYTSLHEF